MRYEIVNCTRTSRLPRLASAVGEVAAIIAAVQAVPPFCPLAITSDSKYAINGLTTHLQTWENCGWIGTQNAQPFRAAAFNLRQRTATTTFKWVKGHSGNEGNEGSDILAKAGSEKDNPDHLALDIAEEFSVQGAKLAALDQATAYRGIQREREKDDPPVASEMLDTIRTALEDLSGATETEETIWRSTSCTTNPILRTHVQQYLFKSIHQTQMVGPKWTNIQRFQQRTNCAICHSLDSMDHIVTRCQANTTRIPWELAKAAWPHRDAWWPNISLGTILGAGCISIPAPRNDQIRRNREQ